MRRTGPVWVVAGYHVIVPALLMMAGPAPAVPNPPNPPDSASATFRGLGDLPGGVFHSQAYGMSADGRVVVGQSSGNTGREACRWVLPGGPQSLGPVTVGPVGAVADSVSDDGSVIVGSRQLAQTVFLAYRWSEATGLIPLGDLPGGPENSIATDTTSDGSVIVGQSFGPFGIEAYRWTLPTGMQPLGDLPGGVFASNALGISGDGSVIIGHGNSAAGIEGWRWTSVTGMVGLGDFPGAAVESSAEGISRNGQFIVGFGRTEQGLLAFRWTAEEGMVPLGELYGGPFLSWGEVVSDDGQIVAGRSEGQEGHAAFFWTPSFGMVPLEPFLRLFGADVPEDWILLEVTGITPDGRSLVGNGVNPSGDNEAWIATLPASLDCEPSTCETCVDTDGDGFGDPGIPTNLCPVDACPLDPDPEQTDTDRDGRGDACDACPFDPVNDSDLDGFCSDADNCPGHFNPDQADADTDGRGDTCDNCPFAENSGQIDQDGDGAGDACDRCPAVPNPGQVDTDADGRGDLCDNCPGAANHLQEDANGDGAGDACQPVVRIDALAPSGGTLFVRAGASDPQGEPLQGRLEIYQETAQDVAISDPAGELSCAIGLLPEGEPGEGIGYAFATTGIPVLFDLDGNLGCVDGLPDFVLGRGRCAGSPAAFDTVLDLSGMSAGDIVCVRAVGGLGPGSELALAEISPGLLRGRLTSASVLVLSTAFGPGLPRQTDISGLNAGAPHLLKLIATDHHTPPAVGEAPFVPQGENALVINHPPRAAAVAPNAAECDRPGAGSATLDGSASSDADVSPDGDTEIVRYEWIFDPAGPAEAPLGEGAVLQAILPLGSHAVGLRVTDRFGESDATTFAVEVRDTQAPTLSLTAVPNRLWPPNHKRVHVRVSWTAADACDAAPEVMLLSAASSEPDDLPGPSDGVTVGDIFDASPGTPDRDIWLRAERQDGGPGRIYTLTYAVVDAAGQVTTTQTTIVVPVSRWPGVDPTRTYRADRARGITAIDEVP